MRRFVQAAILIAVIVVSTAWGAWTLARQRPTRPLSGLFRRSKVDDSGHTRGVVQVDLMRQIVADRARSVPSAADPQAGTRHYVPSQTHPLLGRPAPSFVLEDAEGKKRDLPARTEKGPVVVVFYLGSTCMACMTHLVELDRELPRFRERGTEVWAVSADSPGFSRDRMRRFGGFQIPLLSDPDHAAALAYGTWKPLPGGDNNEGEALHGTFVVDRAGMIRWVAIGDRPFTDIDALLQALGESTEGRSSPCRVPGETDCPEPHRTY